MKTLLPIGSPTHQNTNMTVYIENSPILAGKSLVDAPIAAVAVVWETPVCTRPRCPISATLTGVYIFIVITHRSVTDKHVITFAVAVTADRFFVLSFTYTQLLSMENTGRFFDGALLFFRFDSTFIHFWFHRFLAVGFVLFVFTSFLLPSFGWSTVHQIDEKQ